MPRRPRADLGLEEPKVATKAVARYGIGVALARPPVDEGGGHSQQLRNLSDRQKSRGDQPKLLPGSAGPIPSRRHRPMKAQGNGDVNLANLGFGFDLPLRPPRGLDEVLGNASRSLGTHLRRKPLADGWFADLLRVA